MAIGARPLGCWRRGAAHRRHLQDRQGATGEIFRVGGRDWRIVVSPNRAWLARHPTVSSYIILDDSPLAFGDPPPPELILCDPRTGLSEPRVQAQIREWLAAG